MILPMATIPYGPDHSPPGEGHSLNFPVFGSNRPRTPRALSVYQTTSPEVVASRRGRLAGSGILYVRTAIVSGSILPSLLVRNRVNQGIPLELTTMPYGPSWRCSDFAIEIWPVVGTSLPIMSEP